MATTYAAYYNLATSANSSRKPSTASTGSNGSSKAQKVMNFLAPRIPMHEPLTPTHPTNTRTAAGREREETEYAPARIYDSVLRRPLFQKARKGNEVSRVTESRRGSSMTSSRKPSDNLHLPGAEYFGINEKK